MSTPVNVAVVYYSSTGTTHGIAERLSQAAEKAGAEVRLRKVAELAPDEVVASDPGAVAGSTAQAANVVANRAASAPATNL